MKKAYMPYNKNLKIFSREHRNNSTLPEILFWNCVKASKFNGHKFNRQKPIGNYIVDFYCKKLNPVVEIDGISHEDKYMEDMIRQQNLESMGLNVVRYTDDEVKRNIDAVINGFEVFIEKNCKPIKESPSPTFQGGGQRASQ